MDFNGYLLARNELELFGRLLSPALVISALFYLGSLLSAGLKPYRKNLFLLLVVLLVFGFLGLARFHYGIYQNIIITDPYNGEILSRALIPLWIETEKLFFWLLSFSLLMMVRRHKETLFDKVLGLVLAAFVWIVMIFQNPFFEPLPRLHDELTQAYEILATADPALLGQFLPGAIARFEYFYNSTYMWTHPPLLFGSYAAFLLSFIASVFMFFKQDEEAEKAAYDYCKFGYLLLTFGILIGYPWAIIAWENEPWWWAPKINMSLMMWLLYTAYLHSRLYLHRKGIWRLTAAISFLAFAILILTYATTYFIPGTHSYG